MRFCDTARLSLRRHTTVTRRDCRTVVTLPPTATLPSLVITASPITDTVNTIILSVLYYTIVDDELNSFSKYFLLFSDVDANKNKLDRF